MQKRVDFKLILAQNHQKNDILCKDGKEVKSS